mgnify:CR=1 FL=1
MNTALRIERVGNYWEITDPAAAGFGIKVDAVTVSATRCKGSVVEGYVTAVYGLDLEVANCMDRDQLARLGVSVPRRAARQTGLRLLSLNTDGTIERWVP